MPSCAYHNRKPKFHVINKILLQQLLSNLLILINITQNNTQLLQKLSKFTAFKLNYQFSKRALKYEMSLVSC